MKPSSPTIIIDKREQTPLCFNQLPSIVDTLYSGDYSIQGAEHLFAAERKSLDDLAASCTHSRRSTFEHELLRLRGHRFRRLLIIGSEEAVLARRYRSNMLPKSLLGSIDSFEMRYDVPVVWTASPDSAAKLIERWAQRFVTEITKVSFNVNCGKKPLSHNPVL
jgi:ERCC4-type nuclease